MVGRGVVGGARVPGVAGLLVALLLAPGTAAGVDRVTGQPGRVTGQPGTVIVVETQVSAERFDRGFVSALQADARGDHDAAKAEYERARRLGRCGPRCDWHLRMTDLVLRDRAGARLRPEDVGSNVAYAIQLHNKLVSLQLDIGQMPTKLVQLAKRHYQIALDLAGDAPGARSEVLLGFAAFHGELGDTDIAMKLYRQVDLDGLESATQLGNLAYFYTTVGRLEQAFVTLERALTLDGPRGQYRKWAQDSDDYHRIQHLPRFKELLELY